MTVFVKIHKNRRYRDRTTWLVYKYINVNPEAYTRRQLEQKNNERKDTK